MKLFAQIKNKRLIFDQKILNDWAFWQKDGDYTLEFKKVDDKRTASQNRALHLFFTQLADELNEKGIDMRALIRKDVEISWTGYSIKEYLWKPLLKVMTGKDSTTKMDRVKDISLVYDNLNRIIIERTKGEVVCPPFPSIDELFLKNN